MVVPPPPAVVPPPPAPRRLRLAEECTAAWPLLLHVGPSAPPLPQQLAGSSSASPLLPLLPLARPAAPPPVPPPALPRLPLRPACEGGSRCGRRARACVPTPLLVLQLPVCPKASPLVLLLVRSLLLLLKLLHLVLQRLLAGRSSAAWPL